ncbi:MAG TPA: type II secretion system F family protein [Candidatus Gastranaerophilaceae bacterium]|nr:type II secretion system F family protein [Candidatus Gastranaerophilaceae bacterium]HPT41353.1 type II secretion system F family protein [Candidatus Gastranaerophilaceae bacterium]
MNLIISLTIGIAAAIITAIFLYEPQSPLEKRFKRKFKKRESFIANIIRNLHELLEPLSQKNAKSTIGKTKKLLLQAGEPSSEEDVIKFETQKITGALIAFLICAVILYIQFDFMVLAGCILFILIVYRLPEIKIKKEIALRRKEFMKFIPDAVDLLSICVQAGLGLDSAFSKVAEEFELTSKTISTEFDRLNKDILSGLSRQDAYKNLLLRNENQDLQSFVALLIQTEKLGSSIVQSLEAFCDSMRVRKRQKIEEMAQMASTKMTIPMVIFMMPAIFIIIMYPALQKITTNLGGM